MSYIAHYPLINNTDDIFGHASLSLPNATFVDDGILGSCLYFKSGTNTEVALPELTNSRTLSFAFRIKFNKADALSQRSDIISFYNSNSEGNRVQLRLEISGGQSANSENTSINLFNNNMWTNDGGFGAVNIVRDERHHIAVSISETTCRYYRDGVLVGEQAKVMTNFAQSQLFGTFRLGDSSNILFKMYDLQIYTHALSTKEVKKIYQTCVLDYTFNDPGINFKNLYTGQANYSYQTLTTIETDVFKEYGFDTAKQFKKLSSVVGQNQLLYSYIVPTNISSANGYDKDTEFGISFYAYVPDDFDGLIRITCEQSTAFQLNHCYCSEPTRREWTASNISITTKGKIVYFSLTVKPNSNNALYLMFYWSKSEAAFPMDHGYVLIAGMQFYPIVNGMYHIPPLAIESQSPNYGIIQDGSGWGYDSTGYNIHPPVLTTDTNIGKYAYRAMNDGSCVYFDLPLNRDNIQGTIEFWIKLYSSNAYQGIISANNLGGVGIWISMRCENSGLWFYNGSYYRSNASGGTLSTSGVTLNERHHVVCVMQDKSVSWYYDGKYVNTVTNDRIFTMSEANAKKMFFGGYYPETGSLSRNTKLDAAISSIKFYAKYLTAEEVASNYNEVNRIQVDNKGGLHAACIDENYCEKIRFPKRKNITAERLLELPLQDMKIKLMDDGTARAMLFHHLPEGGTNLFASSETTKVKTEGKYSLLYLLSKYDFTNRYGNYEFLLEYPREFPGQYNRWWQSSNPVTSTTVTNFSNQHADWTGNNRGGLRLYNTAETFIAGCTTTERYYSIGARTKRGTSIPGPNGTAVSEVCLYVRIDNINLFVSSEENANKFKIYKKKINSYNFNERGN